MNNIKTTLTPTEFYSLKRVNPVGYKLLKNYIKERTWGGYRHEAWNYDWVGLTIPRKWFTHGQMMTFLMKHRHLKDYEYLHFTETTYKGKPTVRISWDDKVLRKECDYFWSEVIEILAILQNLLFSDSEKENPNKEE